MSILPYVYKITNKSTGEFYIGSRYKNVKSNRCANDDLFIFYFTSSKMKTQMKTNPENFIYEILFQYEDYDVCFWYEQILIREFIKNENCINGQYIDPDKNSKIFSHSGSLEVRRKISKANTGKVRSNEVKEKLRIIHSSRPRQSHKMETKLKISKTLSGRIRPKEDCYHLTYHTPKGIFNSLQEASIAFNITLGTISNLCSGKTTKLTKSTVKKTGLPKSMINMNPKDAGFYIVG